MSAAQEIKKSSAGKRQSAFLRANDTLVRAYSYFGGIPDKLKATTQTKATTERKGPSLLRIETRQEEYKGPEWLVAWKRFTDEHKLEIFWIIIYTAIITFIFIEKAYSLYFLVLPFN